MFGKKSFWEKEFGVFSEFQSTWIVFSNEQFWNCGRGERQGNKMGKFTNK